MFGVQGDATNTDPGRVVTNTVHGYNVEGLGWALGQQFQQERTGWQPGSAYQFHPDGYPSNGIGPLKWLISFAILTAVLVFSGVVASHVLGGSADDKWLACYDAHPNVPADQMVNYCGRP